MKRFLKVFVPNTPFKKVSWSIGVVVVSLIAALNVAHFIGGNGGYVYGNAVDLQKVSPEQLKTYSLQYAKQHFNPIDASTQVVLEKSVTSEELVNLGLDAVNPGLIDQPPYVLVVFRGNFDITSNNVQFKYAPADLKKPWKYASVVFDLRSSEPASQIISPDGTIFRKVLNDPSLPELKTPQVDPNSPVVQNADGSRNVPAPAPKPHYYGEVLPTLPANTKNP